MAHIPKKQHPIEKLVDDVEFKQRNTTWPDAAVNARGVDEVLWTRSRHITKVQRVDIAVLGVAFVLCGIWFIGNVDLGGRLSVLFGTVSLLVGAKFLWNSIRKNAPKEKQKR
jgi:type IV secretory pathway VirB2 component (pilin)